MKYTLVIKQGQDGFLIGQLKELPAVFSQGLTISELKENIADVLELYLEDMREKYVPQGVMLQVHEPYQWQPYIRSSSCRYRH